MPFLRRAVFAVVLALTGCAHPPRRAGPAAASQNATGASPTPQASAANPAAAERLGTVHVIGTGQRFVLVQTPSSQPTTSLADGQALVCRAGGTVTATLRASHERRPPFVVADVTTGEPHIGDEVFIDNAPGRPTAPDPLHAPPPAAPDFHADPVLPPTR